MTNLHLGCGDDRRPGYINVDHRPTPATDEVVDLNQRPWPWDTGSVEKIVAEHVFEHLTDVEQALRECHRVLKPGGLVRVVWPMGLNELADPDHRHQWVYDSPEMYCGARPWDADVGLSVIGREVSLVTHLDGLAGSLYSGLLRAVEWRQGEGRWQFGLPATSGEFTVVFEK